MTKGTDVIGRKIDAKPIRRSPYRTPYALRGEMKVQIEKMLKRGIILESNSLWQAPAISMSKRPIERPKTSWENDVLEDIRNTHVHNSKKMTQNKNSWKKTIEQTRNLYRF